MHAIPRLLALGLCSFILISLAACEGTPGKSGGGSTSGGGGGGGGSSPTSQEADLAQQVLVLVNQERATAGVAPLAWHAPCAQCAFMHSRDMDLRNFFAHNNPDGQTPFDRMQAAGITYTAAGENIAAGYVTAANVMQGWMNSTGHRTNILNPNFTEIGIGVRIGTTGQHSDYWTQVFRRP